jgi:hypothetical protein
MLRLDLNTCSDRAYDLKDLSGDVLDNWSYVPASVQ